MGIEVEYEHKFARFGEALELCDNSVIQGYASLFGEVDQGGDIVQAGAYRASLTALANKGARVKMLWQHDPKQPIGIWDEIREDDKGLWVKGRVLTEVQRGAEAASLIAAGALEGLSIGYRTLRSKRGSDGSRILQEVDLWEVSLVTFPMLPSAKITPNQKGLDEARAIKALTGQLKRASRLLAESGFKPKTQQTGPDDEQ